MYICSANKSKPAYIPAFERWSLYKSIWMNHWEEFQRIYDKRFFSKYGELSDGKIEEVEKLLGCGNFLPNPTSQHIEEYIEVAPSLEGKGILSQSYFNLKKMGLGGQLIYFIY